MDLSNGAGFPELVRFLEHGLSCEDIMFEGKVHSPKRINLVYDDVARNNYVITKYEGAIGRKYVCKACKKHEHMTSRTSATRRVATAWLASVRILPCSLNHRRM